jgi:hypothetical protein
MQIDVDHKAAAVEAIAHEIRRAKMIDRVDTEATRRDVVRLGARMVETGNLI